MALVSFDCLDVAKWHVVVCSRGKYLVITNDIGLDDIGHSRLVYTLQTMQETDDIPWPPKEVQETDHILCMPKEAQRDSPSHLEIAKP